MRRNGEPDARDFFDSRPTRLCFGEPRLLEMLPACGEVTESLRFWPTGDSSPGTRGAGAEDGACLPSDAASAKTKREGFSGVLLSVAFDRFCGENGVVGAIFSVSRSSSKRS